MINSNQWPQEAVRFGMLDVKMVAVASQLSDATEETWPNVQHHPSHF